MIELIELARRGDRVAREQLLAKLRPQLRAWAENSINAKVNARIDASDIVQATLFDLHEKLDQFAGNSEGEFVDWLRRMLKHNLLDAVRFATAKKRSVHREQRVDGTAQEDHAPRNDLAGAHSTPSVRAIRNENEIRLQEALRKLLPDQQLVVRLVHLQGQSLEKAAQELNRTTAATAKLLQRGIKNLRSALADES
jgi:RNA polymerase sigma-70 factor, ECF subfamily